MEKFRLKKRSEHLMKSMLLIDIYLKQLMDGGLLYEEKVGREKLFIHHRFFNLLLDESDHTPN